MAKTIHAIKKEVASFIEQIESWEDKFGDAQCANVAQQKLTEAHGALKDMCKIERLKLEVEKLKAELKTVKAACNNPL